MIKQSHLENGIGICNWLVPAVINFKLFSCTGCSASFAVISEFFNQVKNDKKKIANFLGAIELALKPGKY